MLRDSYPPSNARMTSARNPEITVTKSVVIKESIPESSTEDDIKRYQIPLVLNLQVGGPTCIVPSYVTEKNVAFAFKKLENSTIFASIVTNEECLPTPEDDRTLFLLKEAGLINPSGHSEHPADVKVIECPARAPEKQKSTGTLRWYLKGGCLKKYNDSETSITTRNTTQHIEHHNADSKSCHCHMCTAEKEYILCLALNLKVQKND